MFMENCIRRSIAEIDKTEKNITFYNSKQRKNCYGYNIISSGRGGKIRGLEFLFSWKEKESESVSELFDRLGNRKEYTDAIGVYMVVNRDDFTPDNPINPTVEELTMMISQPEVLLQHGLELSSEFMSKYSTSMAEAQKHKLSDLNKYKP
ncbi:hypothetical protein [Psychromonas sp. KJ10-2]|uniref:hypothetical protein n=1 Tax=Psychromonas sp. KJ10-2 TaxID=3391822 RepID=UPI0039B61018